MPAALGEHYPTALEAFDDWILPSAWAFVEAFATPEALVRVGQRKWEEFLHVHKLYRPETYEKRLKDMGEGTTREISVADVAVISRNEVV